MFIAKVAAIAAAVSLSLAPSAATALPIDSTTVSQLQGSEQENGAVVFTSEASQLTVLPAEERAVPAADLALLAPSIGCSLSVPWVHPSGHVAGNINGTAKIQCTGNAAKLTLNYSLIRTSPNYKQWGAPAGLATNKAYVQTNRAVSCTEGPANFRGWAQGVIAPPPGYKLVTGATSSKYGDIKPIACGSASFAALSEESGEATTEIQFVREDLVNQ